MNSKTLLEVAEYLKAQANVMASVEKLVPPQEKTETKQVNIFSRGEAAGPWDPKYPGYQSGDAWQCMLRRYAADDGQNRNQYVRDRGLTPRWPDEKQPWEN